MSNLCIDEEFVLGQDTQLASESLDTWIISEGRDPQDFKAELLKEHFSPAELEFRELVIIALGDRISNQ